MDEPQADREHELALGGLQAVFAANIIGIAISDADERVLAANDSYLAAVGYSREDLLAGLVDWRAATPPEFIAADEAALEEYRRRGVSAPFEKAYIHPDGRRVPVVLASASIPGTGGMATFVLDISGRKAAEEALRRSEEQYRELFDAATDAVFLVDRETLQIVDANRMATSLYGYSRDELLTMTAPDFSTDREATAAFVRSVVSGPGSDPQVGARIHRRKDGSLIPVEFTARILSRDGRDLMLVACRDVSERETVARALLDRTTELEEAQRVAHVGSFRWDATTGVLTWSSELGRIFALAPDETPPTIEDAGRLYGVEIAARLHEAVWRALTSGEPYELDATILRRDGCTRHVVERAEVVRDADGSVTGLRGTVTDVTELREAQAVADRAQRVEMVGRLAGGVAHDFNNLLTAIGGHAEFLLASLHPDDPRRPDVTSILDAAARAADLTRQLLAFGRREVLRPSVIAPGDVIQRMWPMLRSIVPADVELVLSLDPVQTCVRVDRDRLGNAVLNLVLNARDAMASGGTLTLATELVCLAAGDRRLPPPALPGEYVRLSVKDTGTGIPDDLLPHIFEPFFTTKRVGRGSGLGLPSVDGFLAQSGGWVAVDTAPGRGSEFSLYLAVEPEVLAEGMSGAVAAPGAPAAGRSVLLVDDEPAVRSITARLLRQLGYTVVEAADGDAALTAWAVGPVDVLVTDVVLPGLSGPDLAARCRAQRPTLPVLLISGYAQEALTADGRGVAGSSFLAKPFSREQLGLRLHELLDAGA